MDHLLHVPWDVMVVRLLMAAGAGAVVGWERELRDHPAGFRTLLLVSAGSCLLTLISISLAGEKFDPGRIAAGIITGIGFLGAGSILRHGGTVQGLTTAASIWAIAAVGMAAGIGWWEAVLAGTLLMILSLTVLKWIERKVFSPRHSPVLAVRLDPAHLSVNRLRDILTQLGIESPTLQVRYEEEDHSLLVAIDLERSGTGRASEVVDSLIKIEGVRSVRIS
ncbi:MAG: MgtC/SapB family protein [Candidatus Zipacnadales bacterium]